MRTLHVVGIFYKNNIPNKNFLSTDLSCITKSFNSQWPPCRNYIHRVCFFWQKLERIGMKLLSPQIIKNKKYPICSVSPWGSNTDDQLTLLWKMLWKKSIQHMLLVRVILKREERDSKVCLGLWVCIRTFTLWWRLSSKTRIIEYLDLEGTHKDQVQFLAPQRTIQKNKHMFESIA